MCSVLQCHIPVQPPELQCQPVLLSKARPKSHQAPAFPPTFAFPPQVLSLLRSAAQSVAVCCSVLQCVAVRCSVLQCVAACRSELCRVLQCVTVCCAVCCSMLQCVAAWCSVLQCAVQCDGYQPQVLSLRRSAA